MKIIVSSKAVERHLRRRGWLEVIQALRAKSENWFVQYSDTFLLCQDGHLSVHVVEFDDDPVSIYLFKGVLAGLENYSGAVTRASS